MITIARTGSAAAVAAEVRDVPARVLPYAASAALTRTALAAQKLIVERMPSVFDRPTPYTLNATRVVPSTVQTLLARVAVKDQAGRGIAPEAFLLPEVAGGSRSEKRFERALRYAGILQPGERVVPGVDAPLDAFGNLQRSVLSRILAVTAARPSLKRRSKASLAEGTLYFVGAIRGQRGVWRRDGRKLSPILIFVRAQPHYRSRLDFESIARAAAEANFPREFQTAVAALRQRMG